MLRINQNPSVWGPSAWNFLDFVTAGYPDVASWSEQVQMTNFLEGFGTALPCEKCRENFKRYASEKPWIHGRIQSHLIERRRFETDH